MKWHKSSYCGTSACLEMCQVADQVFIRDANGNIVRFSAKTWQSFVKTSAQS